MHDITLASEILKIALKEAKGKKISRIKIDLAQDGHTTEDSFKEAFCLLASDTNAEGAQIEIARADNLETRMVELEIEG